MGFKIRNPSKNVKFIVRDKDFGDNYVMGEIWDFHCYDQKFPVPKDGVVIDIGAHIGSFSIYAASKGSQVYAFEPHPKNYALLKANLRINRISTVSCFRMAVSSTTGKRTLFEYSTSGEHSFYPVSGRKISVPCVSLEDIFSRKKVSFCDFLKMDVEGAEFEIILHSPRAVFSRIGIIAMEYHESHGNKVIILKEFLERQGYVVSLCAFNKEQGYLYAKNHTAEVRVQKRTP